MIRLFRLFVPASTVALLTFETTVIVLAFVTALYLNLNLYPTDYVLNDQELISVGVVSLSILAGLYLQNLYSQIRVKSRLLLAQQLLMAAGIMFLIQALISAIAADLYLPSPVMLIGCAISIAVLFIDRILFSTYILPRVAPERLLLFGESLLLNDIAGFLEQQPQLGIQVAGHIRTASPSSLNLEDSIREFQSNRIVVGMPNGKLAADLLELRFLGYSIQEAAGTYAKISNRESLSGMGSLRLLYSREFDVSARNLLFQAIANTVIATLSVILLSPLLLLIPILLRLLQGPVLDRQPRVGRGGRPFTLYSFHAQSMPHPTLLARFLLRTRLYAIPQFFNVLRGDMAIVGPRPQRPEFVSQLTQHIPFYPHRFKTRPGMTGLAQIEMRIQPSPVDSLVELEYDMYYLKYMSPMMDFFVILQSIKNICIETAIG